MLTKKDLQQISEILDQKFDEKLAPIKEELKSHSKILERHTIVLDGHTEILDQHTKKLDEHSATLREQSLELARHQIMHENTRAQLDEIIDKLQSHDKQFKKVDKKLNKLRRDQIQILDVLDLQQMKDRKRILRIEEHLGLPPL